MIPLFKTEPALVASGLTPGVMPDIVPLWSTGQDVVFANGSVQNAPAKTSLLSFTGTPLDIAQSFTLARRRLYIATSTGVFRYIGPQSEFEIPALLATQPPEGQFSQLIALAQDKCLLIPWGDYIISTDGLNPPKYDQNTGAMSNLLGTPFSYARVMWKYQSHLFAADTNLTGRRVYWSALDAPEVWTASLSNDAGSNPLRDLDSRIRCGTLLGGNTSIYSQDQMVMARYIGGDQVFTFSPALYGIGALNPRSIIAHNRFNWGLHRRGIFYTDGITFDYVDEPRVRAWLKANVDFGLGDKICGWHDEDFQMMCWAVPVAGGYQTIGYKYKEQSFTLLNPGVRFGKEADVFDEPILATGDTIYIQNSGTTPASTLVTKPIICQDKTVEKVFQMVEFDWTFDGSIDVDLNFYDNPLGEIQETLTVPASNFERGFYLHVPDGGREYNAMSIAIRAEAGASWRMSGFQIHGEPGRNHK
jgi:hypothetical protein